MVTTEGHQPKLRLIYFGTPPFAVPTLRALVGSEHQIVALVSQPDRPSGRGQHVTPTATKQVGLEAGVPILQPTRLRDDEFLATIASYQPDLGVVAAYGRILPDGLLKIPRLGMINVHGSLLPKYRGAAPVHRAVMAGEGITGVTIMRVVAALDAGPMLATATRPIDPDETSVDVERDLAELGAAALVAVVNQMSKGPVVETPQDDALATYAPKLEKSESPIDWERPAHEIHNRVRGLQPWPMASTTIHGTRCLIHRTRSTDQSTEASAGAVVEATGDALAVATGDRRVLRIVMIQPEGRRVMTVREFLSGRKLIPGTLLGRP
ncbi:MAG TPA: methionyl-tRNA formyltransferase [Vicinamibacterales bacterium]|nr:methionyl-tRNA formyltransferase [Vicinamibacterales bacterium]